jgi:hypothetical protein
MGSSKTSGSLSGSHFAVDARNNSAVSMFGGIVQIPWGPFNLLGSTFTLYVDGVAITAKSLPYVPGLPVLHHRVVLLVDARPGGVSAATLGRLLAMPILLTNRAKFTRSGMGGTDVDYQHSI